MNLKPFPRYEDTLNQCIVCDGPTETDGTFLTCSITCEEVLDLYVESTQKAVAYDPEDDCN